MNAKQWYQRRYMGITMASSIARRICRSVVLSKPTPSHLSMAFCTSSTDQPPKFDGDEDLKPAQSKQHAGWSASGGTLENGVDHGIYKAILVGQVGQPPLQKTLKSGRRCLLFSVGTGGIRNNRTPLMNEDPKEYANRCSVQWHRVCIYQENMVDMAMKHVLPGSIVYLEGNLETRVFTDRITGLAQRLREIAIRRDGRIVFLGEGQDNRQTTPGQFKGVGYF